MYPFAPSPGARLGPPCPRCARRAPVGGGSYCASCGAHLLPLQWVAEPPPSTLPARGPARIRVRYSGPPRYRFVPRWGFPARAWTSPPAPGPPPPDPLHAARSVAGSLVPLLWATASVSLIAAGAEIWRYVLLLASREGALSPRAVSMSDALVTSAGTVAPVLTVITGGLMILWTVRAAAAAADQAGVHPSRPAREIVVGWLVPGLNLAIPGSVLAEIEHTALGLPADRRPRPSRQLLAWWALWGAGVVLAAVVLLWSLRDGVQARADGVVLHALLDLLAVVTAGVTARLVTRLTRLLGPVRSGRRELVVRVIPSAAAREVPA